MKGGRTTPPPLRRVGRETDREVGKDPHLPHKEGIGRATDWENLNIHLITILRTGSGLELSLLYAACWKALLLHRRILYSSYGYSQQTRFSADIEILSAIVIECQKYPFLVITTGTAVCTSSLSYRHGQLNTPSLSQQHEQPYVPLLCHTDMDSLIPLPCHYNMNSRMYIFVVIPTWTA